MVRGYTTIKQSKKLVELGLDPSTADMCYPHFIRHGADTYSETPEIAEDIDYPYEMPCWSLTALLELMPRIIPHVGILCITPSHKDNGWVVGYDEENTSFPTLIDAAFEMVVRLIEQGHIKTSK